MKFQSLISVNGKDINDLNDVDKDQELQLINDNLPKMEFVEITDNKEHKDELAKFEVMCRFGEYMVKGPRDKLNKDLNIDIKKIPILNLHKRQLFAGGILVIRENNLAEIVIYGSKRPILSYVIGYLE